MLYWRTSHHFISRLNHGRLSCTSCGLIKRKVLGATCVVWTSIKRESGFRFLLDDTGRLYFLTFSALLWFNPGFSLNQTGHTLLSSIGIVFPVISHICFPDLNRHSSFEPGGRTDSSPGRVSDPSFTCNVSLLQLIKHGCVFPQEVLVLTDGAFPWISCGWVFTREHLWMNNVNVYLLPHKAELSRGLEISAF